MYLEHVNLVVGVIDAVVARLNNAGYAISGPGAEEPYRKNVYFVDPAGFEVEFVEYLSDIPAERNLNREAQKNAV